MPALRKTGLNASPPSPNKNRISAAPVLNRPVLSASFFLVQRIDRPTDRRGFPRRLVQGFAASDARRDRSPTAPSVSVDEQVGDGEEQ